MIFVILGTQKFQLNRLLTLLDQYIEEEKIQEEVFAQIGYSTYEPKHYSYVRFLDKKDYDQKIMESDIIISHAGVGSILNAKAAKKPIVIFPRLSKYKEHVDDHQLEVAKEFVQKKYVLCCYEHDDLYEILVKSKLEKLEIYQPQENLMIELIQNFFNKVDGG